METTAGGGRIRRRVQCLLWHEISALLNPGERDVVRKTIGPSVIDDNEVLFNEASAYQDIVQSVDDDMQKHVASHRILDTPARQMLEKEIRSLVQHIQQENRRGEEDTAASCSEAEASEIGSTTGFVSIRSGKPSISPRKDPLSLNGKYKNTLDYVLTKTAIQEKQRSPSSTSLQPSSNPGLVTLDPSLIVRKMAPHLTVFGIEAVVDRLRHAFAAEHEALLEDVEYLRAYLEDSTEMYASVRSNPPTLNEMKECGKKLEETFAALKHCQNIQNILAPADRLHGGGMNNKGPLELSPRKLPKASDLMLPKRAIRLPKMKP